MVFNRPTGEQAVVVDPPADYYAVLVVMLHVSKDD